MTTLRRWSITLVTAAVTATLLLGVGLLAFGTGADNGAQAATDTTNPLAGLPPLVSTGQTPQMGPEHVVMPGGRALAPAASPAPGKSAGGVVCGSHEQTTYHVHARLTLFVNGRPRSVPLGIGVGGPVKITQTAYGPWAANGSCFSFLHTHAADGIIHIEAPGNVTFRLGQFFDVWKQRLDHTHLGPVRGRVIAFVDGKLFRGNPRAIPLHKHTQVQLSVGKPPRPQAQITFPPGL